jgi:hypothetical protein
MGTHYEPVHVTMLQSAVVVDHCAVYPCTPGEYRRKWYRSLKVFLDAYPILNQNKDLGTR